MTWTKIIYFGAATQSWHWWCPVCDVFHVPKADEATAILAFDRHLLDRHPTAYHDLTQTGRTTVCYCGTDVRVLDAVDGTCGAVRCRRTYADDVAGLIP